MHFAIFDILLLAVLVFSAFLGLARGFAREIISVIIWVVSFLSATIFAPTFAVYLKPYITSPRVLDFSSFAIIFVAAWFVCFLIGIIINAFISSTKFSIGNRLLGFVFGLVRGALIDLLIVFLILISPAKTDAWFTQSIIAKPLRSVSVWLDRSELEWHLPQTLAQKKEQSQ
jgi:membrane protein required for colicin V production